MAILNTDFVLVKITYRTFILAYSLWSFEQ